MKQRGQLLVSVILIMFIALSLGVVVSTRFFKSVRDFVRTDSNIKAKAVAEALIEKLLSLPEETLSGYVLYNNCGANCSLVLGTNTHAQASITSLGNNSESYTIEAVQNGSVEVSLDGYASGRTFEVCWDGDSSVWALYVYDLNGIFADSYAVNATGSTYTTNFVAASPAHGYGSCFTVNTVGTPKLVRLRPFHSKTTFYVVPLPDQIVPRQGFIISSEGVSGDTSTVVSVTKLYRSLPGVFDYALQQNSNVESLYK